MESIYQTCIPRQAVLDGTGDFVVNLEGILKSDNAGTRELLMTVMIASSLQRAGAVLCIVRSGILAHTFPIGIAANEVAFNQDINAIVVDEKFCNPEWLFHVLRSFERDILTRGTK